MGGVDPAVTLTTLNLMSGCDAELKAPCDECGDIIQHRFSCKVLRSADKLRPTPRTRSQSRCSFVAETVSVNTVNSSSCSFRREPFVGC